MNQTSGSEEILNSKATHFLSDLHRRFNSQRVKLLRLRSETKTSFNNKELPSLLKETQEIRRSEWKVAQIPQDLLSRDVEITGPAEAKMMINALNSGASVFMADFEDSLSPTWANIIQGQVNLMRAVRRELSHISQDGKKYVLKDKIATLLVRPRGWHLVEKNFFADHEPISASLFDFGLYCFHNGEKRIQQENGLYFYIPKLENHLEARLWNDVFDFTEKTLNLPHGTIRVTVLIETITAAFQMEEILFEMKDHILGLNAGRWDYIFSIIKKFHARSDFIFPDRSQVTMTTPFMRAYAQRLVQICHRRGAQAIGGMAAFVPSRKDPKINELALAKVREDKEREVRDGFDGTWVAHPDLVPVAREAFDQKEEILRRAYGAPQNDDGSDLLNFHIPGGQITAAGIQNNISVSLQYLNGWLQGVGASAIYNLMEDVATAEIARSQLWQWIHHCPDVLSKDLYKTLRDQELDRLGGIESQCFAQAVELLDGLVLSDHFSDFLTLSAYPYLD